MVMRDYIFHHFWMKVLSLALAIMTWFTIFAIQRNIRLGQVGVGATRTFAKHPITVMKSAADSRGFRVIPSEVDVTISGRPLVLQKVTAKDVEVFINLTDVLGADHLTKKVLIYTPEGTAVVEIKPDVVRIERVNP